LWGRLKSQKRRGKKGSKIGPIKIILWGKAEIKQSWIKKKNFKGAPMTRLKKGRDREQTSPGASVEGKRGKQEEMERGIATAGQGGQSRTTGRTLTSNKKNRIPHIKKKKKRSAGGCPGKEREKRRNEKLRRWVEPFDGGTRQNSQGAKVDCKPLCGTKAMAVREGQNKLKKKKKLIGCTAHLQRKRYVCRSRKRKRVVKKKKKPRSLHHREQQKKRVSK